MAMVDPAAASALMTIGIPTYSRRDTVTARARELMAMELPSDVEVLIIDNASPDGTADELRKVLEGVPRFRLLVNEANVGFAGNVVRLFREARGEYLLLVSDEDPVLRAGLERLLELCRTQQASFICPQMWIEGGGGLRRYRGRSRRDPIRPEDVVASTFYISGITYHVATALQAVERVDGARDRNNAVHLYPQEFIAAPLVAQGRAMWFEQAVAGPIRKKWLPSHLRDISGEPYPSVGARWRQFLDRDAMLVELRDGAPTDAERSAFERMIRANRERVYEVIHGAVRWERPDLVKALDVGAGRVSRHPNAAARTAMLLVFDARWVMPRIGSKLRELRVRWRSSVRERGREL